MELFRGKSNANANARLVLYYFTISFVVFNRFNRSSVICIIWLVNTPHEKFISWYEMQQVFLSPVLRPVVKLSTIRDISFCFQWFLNNVERLQFHPMCRQLSIMVCVTYSLYLSMNSLATTEELLFCLPLALKMMF